MTTEIGALRRAFETYINPDADVNLHWLAAGYYAGRGVQQSWLDFQAGHAAGVADERERDPEVEKPDPGKFVLAWIEGGTVPIRAMWVPARFLTATDHYEGWSEYDEDRDEYFCPEGWYENNRYEETHWQVDAKVVAWMPLPVRAAAAIGAQKQEGG